MARRTIDDLLSERHKRFTPLQRLLRRAADYGAWTAQVRALLPTELAERVWVSTRQGPLLTLHVSDAATGTRLRFYGPQLLEGLQSLRDFLGVEELRIRVNAHLDSKLNDDPAQHQQPPTLPAAGASSGLTQRLRVSSEEYQRLNDVLLRINQQISSRKA